MNDNMTEIERRIREAQERRGSTFHGYANRDVEDNAGGRFGTLPKPTVIGSTASISYPQQPSGSPWKEEPIGQEKPLGYNIDEQEPVGEVHERNRSPGDATADNGDVPVTRSAGIRLRRRI